MLGTATDLDRHPLPAAAPHSTARGHIPPPAQHPSMEVSTVTTPPASPIEGDDPCGIDATNVGLHSVMLLISLCGLVGNGAVISLVQTNPITDIFRHSVTDFLFLVFMVPSTLLFLVEDMSCSAVMPLMYLSLLFQLSLYSFHLGLLRLMYISFERCRSILCPLCCSCKVPECLFWAMMDALFWVFFFTFVAVNPTVTSLCQSHEQEHCRVALISLCTMYLILFAAPLVIYSAILFIRFKRGSQQKQRQRFDVAMFLAVVFCLPLSLWNFLQQLGYTVVSSQVVFLLTCITSTIKPLIYFSVGSWKRHCSVESCGKHFSKQCLREILQRVSEDQKKTLPAAMTLPRTQQSEPVDPFPDVGVDDTTKLHWWKAP